MADVNSKRSIEMKLADGVELEIHIEKEKDFEANALLQNDTARENGEEEVQLLEGYAYEYQLRDGYTLEEIPNIVHRSMREKHRGRITPGIYVGRLPLTVYRNGDVLDTVAVEVRSQKADYRSEYRQMLEDITSECTELIMLHSSPVAQRFAVDYEGEPETLYQRFAFVKSIVDSENFRNAIHRIIAMPTTTWARYVEEVDTRRARRITPKHIRQIASRSDRINLPPHHPLRSQIKSIPSKLTTEIKVDTVDTPENRFVKHALKEFERFCGFICRHIENNQPDHSKRPHIYHEAKALEERFSGYLNHSMFREILPPTSLPLNSPVLQRKEGYREILRVWLMYDLAAKLVWDVLGDDVYDAGKRDVATLYEYWLFFKLLRLVEEIFDVEPTETKDLIKETADGLGLQLRSGRFIAVQGEYRHRGRDLKVKFSYNRTFGASGYPQEGSWTQQMRPDYTLSLWPSAFGEDEAEKQELIVHVHFDAKYKVQGLEYLASKDDDESTTEEDSNTLLEEKDLEKKGTYKRADLLKMHAYKDAIRRTAGAYVLYPGTKSYNRWGFHEIIPGLGAFPVSPSDHGQGIEDVRHFIYAVIEHLANRASQRERLSYHQYDIHKSGQSDEVHETMPEYRPDSNLRAVPPSESTVLVGYYNADQYKWVESEYLYNIRVDNQNGLEKFSSGITGAKYLLLHGAGELETSKIWEIVGDAPELISKEDLKNKKNYPTEPSCENYLLFQIKPVKDGAFGDDVWDIRKLSGYRSGRGSARPFAVTLTELSKVLV